MFTDQLWSHIGWRSTKDFELLLVGTKGGKTKIYNFDHVSLVFYKNIVKLNVPMSNSSCVQIVKCFYDLSEKLPANRLFHLSICALLLDVLMKRYTLNIIRNDADLFSRFYQIVHLYDVWVVYFLQGHYFSLDGFSFHRVVEFCFLVDFDRIFPHIYFMVANIHDSVCSLTNRLTDLIVFQNSSLNCLAL